MVSQNIRTAALHLIETHLVSGWASEQTSKKERGDSIEPYRLNFMYVNVCECVCIKHTPLFDSMARVRLNFFLYLSVLFFQNPSPAAPSPANSLFINCILLHSKTKVLRRTTKTLTFTHTQRDVCSRREREKKNSEWAHHAIDSRFFSLPTIFIMFESRVLF